jgi:hypothetical protein
MKQGFLGYALVALVFGGLVATAVADDLYPPWWRGSPGTTSQMWQFLTPDPVPPPDGPAPGGLPPLPSTHVSVIAHPWVDYDPASGREGIWPLADGDSISVTVDNFPQQNPEKWMHVQLTWIGASTPVLSGFSPLPGTPISESTSLLADGWKQTVWDWKVFPNPPDESFVINGSARIDQLVIDTACVPEPSTLVLLAAGVLLAAWVCWRRGG